MGHQSAPNGSLGLPCGLYQFMSHSEGTALLLESKWLLYNPNVVLIVRYG